MAGAFAPGAAGWLLYSEEPTPGTYQTPTNVLWATAISNQDIPEPIRKAYFAGYRAAETGLSVGKVSSTGNLQWPLMPNAGVPWLKFALGKSTPIFARLTWADTVAGGGITTASGISTIPITTGGATITAGDWIKVNTGASAEYRPLLSYNNSTKIGTVLALTTNASAAAGVVVAIAKQDVTVTSAVSTALGLSTMTLTTGAAYQQGDWLYFGTGATLEAAQVYSYNSVTKQLTVQGLKYNGSAAVGLRVIMPHQQQFALKSPLDTNWTLLPSVSVAFAKGGLYDTRYPGCYAGSYALQGTAQGADVTCQLVPTMDMIYNATPTSFAPTSVELGDQSDFFTINNGSVLTPIDYDASGTSSPGKNVTVETWSLTVNNSNIVKKHWNGTTHEEGYPGLAKVSGSYTYTNHAKRNVELMDYALAGSYPSMPFMVSLYNYTGPSNTPQCCGLVVPNAQVMGAPETDQVGQYQTIAVSFEASRPTGGDIILVNVVNQAYIPY